MPWVAFWMKLYKGKCLTWINIDESVCFGIFNFFICYRFSALYPVDVQGVLFRYNPFCCGYSNVMIVFTGSLRVHGNGKETRFGKKTCQKCFLCFLWEMYVWCVPCYSFREAGMARNLTWMGMASFKGAVQVLHGNARFWPGVLLRSSHREGEWQEGRFFLSAACA